MVCLGLLAGSARPVPPAENDTDSRGPLVAIRDNSPAHVSSPALASAGVPSQVPAQAANQPWVPWLIALGVAQLLLIIALLSNRADRRRSEQKLREHLRFEKLVSDLSATFITLPFDRVDEQIEAGLARVLDIMRLDSCSIFSLSPASGRLRLSHQTRPKTTLRPPESEAEAGGLHWLADRLKDGTHLALADVARDLPADAVAEREFVERNGAGSMLFVPVDSGAETIRGVLFQTGRREPKNWPSNLVSRLELLSRILIAALARKDAEQELRVGNDRNRAIMEAIPDLVFLHSKEGVYLDYHAPIRGDLIAHPEKLLGRNVRDVLPQDLAAQVLACFDRVLKTGAGETLEYSLNIDGQERNFEGRMVRCGDRVLSLVRNISERKRAEKALRESEARFRTMADSVPVFIWMTGPDKGCTYLNQHWLDFTGRTLEQELGHRWIESIHPDDRGALQAYFNAFDKRLPCKLEYRLRRRDGEYRWIADTGVPRWGPEGEFLGYVGSAIDTTDRKQAEEALRRSELLNRSILESVREHVAVLNQKGEIVATNQSWKDFGRRNVAGSLAGVPVGVNYLDVCRRAAGNYEHMASAALSGVQSVLERAYDTFEMEYRCDLPSAPRWFLITVTPLNFPDGGAVITHRDVTQRKVIEEALRASEERYREVVESQTDLVCRYLPDTTLTFVNEAFCRFFAKQREELIGMKFLELLPESARKTVLNNLTSLTRGEKVITTEHEVLLPDGTIGWQHWVDYPVADPDGQIVEFQGIGRDITDRKRADEARRSLAHASRLAAIGELTAMIGHELNQPLAAILTNTDAAEKLLTSKSPPLQELLQILTEIRADDLRASESIIRIRNLSRKGETEMQLLNVNDLIREVLRFIQGDAQVRRIQLKTELAPSLPPVYGDRVQLQQVLLNLVLNAMDALADNPEDKRLIQICTSTHNCAHAEVSVKDSGKGITPDKLLQVFDSFFTTKKKGLGLGLSLAQSIINTHRGRIWAENDPAGGAIFRFTLPAARESQPDPETVQQGVRTE